MAAHTSDPTFVGGDHTGGEPGSAGSTANGSITNDPVTNGPVTNDPVTNGPVEDDPIGDPAEALKTIENQARHIDETDGAYFNWGLSFIWGFAWFLGYGSLALGTKLNADGGTPVWAAIMFGVFLISGIVLSIVFGMLGQRGRKGESSRIGMIYGWMWMLAFCAGFWMLGYYADKFGLSNQAATVLFNAVATLIVGIIYMAGCALFKDMSMLIIAILMFALTVCMPALTGSNGYLALSLLGGGAFLLSGVYGLFYTKRHPSFDPYLKRGEL
jgi:hypothetical protein